MKRTTASFYLLIAIFTVHAQPLVTVDDAIGIALKNNFDVLVERTGAETDRVNNTAGNAGMLPSVAATASETYSISTADQKSVTAPETKTSNAGASAFSAGVALGWTLFDGGKMFVTKRKLNEIEALGWLKFKARVMQTEYAVIAAYYDVVRQKQQLASINEVLAYNKERVNILQTSFGAGLSPKTTLLQAQIDLNVYKENALAQQTLIKRVKRALNLLLCRDTDTPFEVIDSIPLGYTPDKTALMKKLFSNNVDIASFTKQVEIARLSLSEARTLRLPKINVTAGYFGSQTDNPSGAITYSRTYGPQVGGTVTVPLYQAGNVSRQIAAAALQLQSTQYGLENEKQQAAVQLLNSLDEFENQRLLLEIETQNVGLARENLDISMQRLRLGQSTSLELRQAQDSYEESETRLLAIEYTLKVAETLLKQLVAEL
jgi:outer membrane protein